MHSSCQSLLKFLRYHCDHTETERRQLSISKRRLSGIPIFHLTVLRGEIIKCLDGRPAKLPKPNRAISGILENTSSNRPATKKCPAGLPGAQTQQKIARPGTHRSAAICGVFRGHDNKAPPKTCTTTIVDTKLILSKSFTHDWDQISSVKREKDRGT